MERMRIFIWKGPFIDLCPLPSLICACLTKESEFTSPLCYINNNCAFETNFTSGSIWIMMNKLK